MTPFEVLSVPEDADDAAIKQAYLAKIRIYTPEHAPVQFQRVRDAYESIQTARKRLEYELFSSQSVDKAALRGHLLNQTDTPRRPDVNTFRAALRAAMAQ